MSTTQNAGPSWLPPYEVRRGADIIEIGQPKLEHHQILHYIRGSLEERHRRLKTFQIQCPHFLKDMPHLGEIMGLNCWNKTVLIFLLKGPPGSRGLPFTYFGLPSTTTSIAGGSTLTVWI